MKKWVVVLVLILGLILCGCAGRGISDSQGENGPGTGDGENLAGDEDSMEMPGETDSPEEGSAEAGERGTEAVQGGPFGKISVTLPSGWKYETCPIDCEELLSCRYGIHFYPEDADKGYIEIGYAESFGVCGTGLEETSAVIAGGSARVGTYDGHEYWDFVCFKEPNEHVVALSCCVGEWWGGYRDQIMEILDTLSFDPDVKEGGAYVYRKESERDEIGLYFYLTDISPQGATLCYHIYDQEARTGELSDGDYYKLEQLAGGKWEEVPVAVEGDYGFHDIAYDISGDETIKRDLDWKWLYGELSPGQYRIEKQVMDFRKTGDFDLYTIHAYFTLN